MLPGSHKSNFERPHHLYGTYGEAERRKWRQDQYPATGNFGEHTGAKWHDLFGFDGTLDEEAVDMGLKALTPKAGDVLIMPEALTHGVMPWLPEDRPRRTLMLRYQQQTMPPHNNPPIGPDVVKRLAPETRELIAQASIAHTKEVAKHRRPWSSDRTPEPAARL